MLMSYLLAASFTAVIASATPLTRSIGPGCRSFPTNGVDTLLDFTLVAQYDSDTSIHKQLVLGADGSDPAPNITFVGVCSLFHHSLKSHVSHCILVYRFYTDPSRTELHNGPFWCYCSSSRWQPRPQDIDQRH